MPNPLAARAQHARIAVLNKEQPARPVLVQPRAATPDAQKQTRWVPVSEVNPQQELWTRSVLLNEVLFDVDVRPWSRVAETTGQLLAGLDALAVPRETYLTGGKGTHTSVFLDPESIKGDGALLGHARDLGVDLWSVARLTIAEALLDAAGFPAGDVARWAAPIGAGPFDRLKVKWHAARQGSMVRVEGCWREPPGFRKTLAPAQTDWPTLAALPSPPSLPLLFPDAPPARWGVPKALSERIMSNVENACRMVEAVQAAQPAAAVNQIEARKQLLACPCARRTLTEPTPRGSRHFAFLNLAVTMRTLGLPKSYAEATMKKVLFLNHLPSNDSAMNTLAEVYSGRYRLPRLTCPSPHVAGLCQPAACPFAGCFTLG